MMGVMQGRKPVTSNHFLHSSFHAAVFAFLVLACERQAQRPTHQPKQPALTYLQHCSHPSEYPAAAASVAHDNPAACKCGVNV